MHESACVCVKRIVIIIIAVSHFFFQGRFFISSGPEGAAICCWDTSCGQTFMRLLTGFLLNKW